MLARTADHLYWMARQIERAENITRLLDVTWQMSLVPQADGKTSHSWAAALSCNSLLETYQARFGPVESRQVLYFMLLDPDNPSSIYSCLKSARENAHAVRGTLTTEMWETINATWLEMAVRAKRGMENLDPGECFEWVKTRSSLSRGVTFGTMLHDEAFHFVRLGTYLERADSTAGLLDVKYHLLEAGVPGDEVDDYYQWGALLRAVSAFEMYRHVYRDTVTPQRVAELLILHPDMPRSLRTCLESIDTILSTVANAHSGETQRRAGLMQAELRYARIEDIIGNGLHDYLVRFRERIFDLGNRINQVFLMPSY